MRNTQKFALICCCMIGAGVLLSGVGYAMGGRVWGIGVGSEGLRVNTPNVSGKSVLSYVEETKELEEFSSMDIELDFGELTIEPSDHFGISYCVESEYDFSVEVSDGCLTITEKYPSSFGSMGNDVSGNFVVFGVGNIGTSGRNEYVKIYVPADAGFDKVKLSSDYGAVTAGDLSAKELEIHADFGDVNLERVDSEMATITLGGGNLELRDFADGDLNIENDFGETILENVTAGDVKITMESGDMDLTNLSAKNLQVTSEFGNVEGKKVNAGEGNFSLESGSCDLTELSIANLEITSEFGDVKLGITDPVVTYALDLATDFGTVEINRRDMGVGYKSLEARSSSMVVRCDSGDITIREEN